MLDHYVDQFIYDSEFEIWTALCYCGWETEAASTRFGAKKLFNDNHCLSGIEQAELLHFHFNSDKDCSFCGCSGHTQKTCSRKPLVKI